MFVRFTIASSPIRFFSWPKARVHEHLALLRHVVLGVLAQVAQRDRLLDLGREFGRQLVLELLDLLLRAAS